MEVDYISRAGSVCRGSARYYIKRASQAWSKFRMWRVQKIRKEKNILSTRLRESFFFSKTIIIRIHYFTFHSRPLAIWNLLNLIKQKKIYVWIFRLSCWKVEWNVQKSPVRGSFLERPGNLSSPKSNSWNCDPLALKTWSFNMFQI